MSNDFFERWPVHVSDVRESLWERHKPNFEVMPQHDLLHRSMAFHGPGYAFCLPLEYISYCPIDKSDVNWKNKFYAAAGPSESLWMRLLRSYFPYGANFRKDARINVIAHIRSKQSSPSARVNPPFVPCSDSSCDCYFAPTKVSSALCFLCEMPADVMHPHLMYQCTSRALHEQFSDSESPNVICCDCLFKSGTFKSVPRFFDPCLGMSQCTCPVDLWKGLRLPYSELNDAFGNYEFFEVADRDQKRVASARSRRLHNGIKQSIEFMTKFNNFLPSKPESLNLYVEFIALHSNFTKRNELLCAMSANLETRGWGLCEISEMSQQLINSWFPLLIFSPFLSEFLNCMPYFLAERVWVESYAEA